MVIFVPSAFEEHLHIDRSKHFVVHMNASSLPTYFPYWDRVQAIRTSRLWTAQAESSGWINKSPQVGASSCDGLKVATAGGRQQVTGRGAAARTATHGTRAVATPTRCAAGLYVGRAARV